MSVFYISAFLKAAIYYDSKYFNPTNILYLLHYILIYNTVHILYIDYII
jgi:hypothetical protein